MASTPPAAPIAAWFPACRSAKLRHTPMAAAARAAAPPPPPPPPPTDETIRHLAGDMARRSRRLGDKHLFQASLETKLRKRSAEA